MDLQGDVLAIIFSKLTAILASVICRWREIFRVPKDGESNFDLASRNLFWGIPAEDSRWTLPCRVARLSSRHSRGPVDFLFPIPPDGRTMGGNPSPMLASRHRQPWRSADHIMGTILFSVLNGHWRCAYINGVHHDGINPKLLELRSAISEDDARPCTVLKKRLVLTGFPPRSSTAFNLC